MNVYVESNFVLELALLQEQSESCHEILSLCEANRAQLIVPAYCLAEPYETLTRRQKRRRTMREDIDRELKQIARTEIYADQLEGFGELTDVLIRSAEGEDRRLKSVSSRFLQVAQVIPLNASTLADSSEYRSRYSFSPQDALVYASVLSHLEENRADVNCFLNKDKDFDDDDVVEELRGHDCILLPRFDVGYRFILKNLGEG